ncbi:hypothetical protein GUITHDRAFT_80038, partial [Guillardia theta CCMP2712]
RLNMAKIQHQWRKIMRVAKVEQLRHELEIMSQNHEREVDMKDAIIQMLDRDLDEAEEQYQTALRSHLHNLDTMINLFDAKMSDLRMEFESELQRMINDFSKERRETLEGHNRRTKEFSDILDLQEEQFQMLEEEQHQEFESHCEEIKNKNMEELNVLRLTLEGQIEDLEKHFLAAADSYSANTKDKARDCCLTPAQVQKFKEYTERDRKAAMTIDTQMKRLLRLQDNLALWRAKIASNTEESVKRNSLLKKEKESLQEHFNRTKLAMNRMREEQATILKQLSVECNDCDKTLSSNIALAERILNTAELNRKLETEREKVVPFYPSLKLTEEDELSLNDPPAGLQEEAAALSSYCRSQSGQTVEKWNMLDNFLRKYNMVLLDKEAIRREKERLLQENGDLRSILKQYLDGISVNQNVLQAPNPLMIVNERSNIQAQPQQTSLGPSTIVDGYQVVAQQVRVLLLLALVMSALLCSALLCSALLCSALLFHLPSLLVFVFSPPYLSLPSLLARSVPPLIFFFLTPRTVLPGQLWFVR